MNGTECRPQAPVAERGPESYEGYLGDTPKTLSVDINPPNPPWTIVQTGEMGNRCSET